MVVIPTLLPSVERVNELVEHLEVLALGNLDAHVHFALLGDFTDAPAREMPRDAAILDAARAGIEALNARHSEGRGDRFYLVRSCRLQVIGEELHVACYLSDSVSVFAPDADGDVPPLRTLGGAATGIVGPASVVSD